MQEFFFFLYPIYCLVGAKPYVKTLHGGFYRIISESVFFYCQSGYWLGQNLSVVSLCRQSGVCEFAVCDAVWGGRVETGVSRRRGFCFGGFCAV